MASLGSLVVNLGLNTSGMTAGGNAARGTLASLATGTERLNRSTGSLEGGLGRLTGSLRSLALAATAVAGIGSVFAGLSRGIELAATAEQNEVAFGTILGSAEAAEQSLRELNQYAASTPFQLPEIVTSGRQLLAFGTAAEDLLPSLRRIGDVSAGIGAPLGEIAEAYGKMRVQGRITMEDVNQLTGRGIPVIQEFAKQFGVADSEVRKLVESGQVNFGNLEQAFVSLTSEGGIFFDLTRQQSETLAGLWSTFSDTLDTLLSTIAGRLMESFDVKELIDSAIEFMGDFIDITRVVLDALEPFAPYLRALTVVFAAVSIAVLAYAAAQKLAAIAMVLFTAVSNPAGIVAIGVALGAATLIIGGMEESLAGVTAEAKAAQAAVAGVAPGVGGDSDSSEPKGAWDAVPANFRTDAAVGGWLGQEEGADKLVDKLRLVRMRLDEMAVAKDSYNDIWQEKAAPWLDGLDGMTTFTAAVGSAERETTQLKNALGEVAAMAGDLGADQVAELQGRIKDQIGQVSGISAEIDKIREQTAVASGSMNSADQAESKFYNAGALPEQLLALREAMRELEAVQGENKAAETIAALEQQVGLLSGTVTEADAAVAALGLNGIVSEETLDRMRELHGEIDRLKELDKLNKLGEQIAEQFRTPAEVLRDRMKELRDLFAAGAIDQETYDRARKDAEKTARGGDRSAPAGPNAIAKGSQEAFSLISARIRGDADKHAQRTASNTAAMVAALQTANGHLAGIAAGGAAGGLIPGEELG